jgi:hypothetical protein
MRHSWFLTGSFVVLMVLIATPVVAQSDPLSASTLQASTEELMEVSGTAVRVRSGPGTYFYEVAQLNEPTQMPSLGREHGWVAIKPPASVVALIKKTQVTKGDADQGLVDSDATRVYAKERSSVGASSRTWAVIAQLDKDAIIKILGQESDFYRIEMPAAARVYVSGRFLKKVMKPVAPVDGSTPVQPPFGTPTIKKLVLDPQDDAYDVVVEALEAEMKKPLMDRVFDTIEADLAAVEVKAKATYLLSDIEATKQQIAFQKTLQEGVTKRAAEQAAFKQQLDAVKQKEDEILGTEGVSPIDEMQTFAFEGTLKPMRAKMAQKFRLENDQGRFICLLAGDEATLQQFLGRKVRVWGDKDYRVDLKMTVCTVKRIEDAPLGE